MTLSLDWWQAGWALAGFWMILFFGLWFASRGKSEKGYREGYHDRQHWETDAVVKGKLERP